MNTVSGKVASKSRKGNSIKVGDDWYSTFAAKDLDHVNWKDEVEFIYDTKGKYKNIKGVVKVLSSGGDSGSSGGSGGKSGGSSGYSNLGVEIGHASNLAMRMMEQGGDALVFHVGSAEYFKQFAKFTADMHKVMTAIRASIEAGDKPVEAAPEPPPAKSESTDVDLDDLF